MHIKYNCTNVFIIFVFYIAKRTYYMGYCIKVFSFLTERKKIQKFKKIQ